MLILKRSTRARTLIVQYEVQWLVTAQYRLTKTRKAIRLCNIMHQKCPLIFYLKKTFQDAVSKHLSNPSTLEEAIREWAVERYNKKRGWEEWQMGNFTYPFFLPYTANIYRMVIGNFNCNPLSAYRILPIGNNTYR